MKTTFLKTKQQIQRGFTLVEIAIVLVIVGLLIGGILRGQELITSARVRNLIDQKTAVQAAYYGFIDRFRMQPGDLTVAQAALVNNQAAPAYNGPGDGWVVWTDSPQFFNNLAQSGFLSCAQCMVKQAAEAVSLTNTNSPTNVYGTPIWYESNLPGLSTAGTYALTPTGTTETPKPKLSTGNTISSEILAEMDRKVDDGDPARGQFRASDWNWTASVGLAQCVVNTAPNTTPATWLVDNPGQCQGVSLM